MAVFGTSAGSTGTYLMVSLHKVQLENMVAPCRVAVKSWICGIG